MSAITERFIRGSGPGGQNVNKVATAVELRYDVAQSDLPDVVKVRLRSLAGTRLTTEDVIVIAAREHRTQAENRKAARERLDALIERAHRAPRRRKPTRPSKAAKERRLQDKRERSQKKLSRTRRADDS